MAESAKNIGRMVMQYREKIFLRGSEIAANRGFYLRAPYPTAIS